jgi:hypothetical protein
MKSKMWNRTLLAMLAVAVIGAVAGRATVASAEEKKGDAEYLFVQNASSGSFDGKVLTLEGVGSTLFFTDRPNRIVGHVDTARLIKEVSTGKDNFKESPPNATISILDDKGVTNAVVVLLEPKFDGHTIAYPVQVLDGDIPATFKAASLFIDRWGRGAMFLTGAIVGGAVGHAAGSSSAQEKQTTTYVVADPPVSYQSAPTSTGRAQKEIQQLKQMEAQGLITPEQYDAKQKEIVNKM